MNRLLIASMALAACGGSSPDCKFLGRDCGPTLTATMIYLAGNGAGPQCRVTASTSKAQFDLAVAPAYCPPCTCSTPSDSTRTIDCGSSYPGSVPPGTSSTSCAWTPPGSP